MNPGEVNDVQLMIFGKLSLINGDMLFVFLWAVFWQNGEFVSLD